MRLARRKERFWGFITLWDILACLSFIVQVLAFPRDLIDVLGYLLIARFSFLQKLILSH